MQRASVRRRVDFKLATLMFKSLHGCAALYLSDTCKSAPEASRRLRSSGAIYCGQQQMLQPNSAAGTEHVAGCDCSDYKLFYVRHFIT